MKPEQHFHQILKMTEQYLHACVKEKKPHSLYDPSRYILQAGGKRIRPALLLLACESVGGHGEDAVHAAAGIEILHNFTLVHDDIMDHADTRRGRETVHKKWDENVAILAGDALLALAYRAVLLTPSEHLREIVQTFTEAVVVVCEGQAYDKEFEARRRVHVNEYLMMIEKKTGKLLTAALRIGGLIGNASKPALNALQQYGDHIGRAFQIQDDLLDVIGDEKEFGKTIGRDLMEGKKTFLLLEALRLAKGTQKQMLERICSHGGIQPRQIGAYRKIFEETGALDSARRKIEDDLEEATRVLEALPPSLAKDTFFWLTERLMNRTY
jgi:geranylgeranyl diphosphate synthase type II